MINPWQYFLILLDRSSPMRSDMPRFPIISFFLAGCLAACTTPDREPGARYQPGTEMGLYTPQQHDFYDGRLS